MAERPIMFSAPMVRALLAGTKTQTRRVLHPQPPSGYALLGIYAPRLTAVFNPGGRDRPADPDWDVPIRLPCKPGDRLWVREAFCAGRPALPSGIGIIPERRGSIDPTMKVEFAADWGEFDPPPWRSPRFMPRWASRLTLQVTSVRVQRLHEISEADAIAEGVSIQQFGWHGSVPADGAHEHIGSYAALWEHLHGPGSWDANPWVAAITFRVLRDNIDNLT